MRRPGEEFRVYWTEEEGQKYEAEGLVSVIEWDPKPEDEKPRKGGVAVAKSDAPVDSVLYKRVERLEDALSDAMRTIDMFLKFPAASLTHDEVGAIRVALGTEGDDVEQGGQAIPVETELSETLRVWLAVPVEELASKLDASRMDDLRAIANDLSIPNLHGNMKKVDLVALIIDVLAQARAGGSPAGDGAIVADGVPVVPSGGSS